MFHSIQPPMLVLSRKNLLACSQFPLITRAEYEEMRRDAYAPLGEHDLARVVAASDEPQPVQLDGVRVPGATAFYLDENDVEQVAALERSVAWRGCAVFFRIARTSTMPRHSPWPAPRNETNFHRSATRLLSARNIISAQRPVAWAFSYGSNWRGIRIDTIPPWPRMSTDRIDRRVAYQSAGGSTLSGVQSIGHYRSVC